MKTLCAGAQAWENPRTGKLRKQKLAETFARLVRDICAGAQEKVVRARRPGRTRTELRPNFRFWQKVLRDVCATSARARNTLARARRVPARTRRSGFIGG